VQFSEGRALPVGGAAFCLRHYCILRSYRSAKNVFAEWEPNLVNTRAAGLVLCCENDPVIGAADPVDRLIERASCTAIGGRISRKLRPNLAEGANSLWRFEV
jgi:hypothetical protein